MKSALNWIILLVVVAVAAGTIYFQYERGRPCAEPITYSIGAIDPRFDISTSTLLATAENAAAIWNKAAGKNLLEYEPAGAVKINLVYDTRQAAAELGATITEEQADAESAREAIEAERPTVTPQDAASFDAQVNSYNASIVALNAKINQYNQEVGQTFEEGEYVSNASGKRINIFEFIGTTQLERVLAHELGHAIGLAHNTNPASIMYAKSESGNLVPTVDDLAALKGVCGSEIKIK